MLVYWTVINVIGSVVAFLAPRVNATTYLLIELLQSALRSTVNNCFSVTIVGTEWDWVGRRVTSFRRTVGLLYTVSATKKNRPTVSVTAVSASIEQAADGVGV